MKNEKWMKRAVIVCLGARLMVVASVAAPPATGSNPDSVFGVPGAAPNSFADRYGIATDPAMGLPAVAARPEWKDPNWTEPEKVLGGVVYDGLPVSEVAHHLREEFKQEFDVLLPSGGPWEKDWRDTPINLRLKNVSASEVFNAMNLLFETERTPLRWNLIMNGNRPTALLRVIAEPSNPYGMRPEERRMVFFVGDLIGDEKSGGMTMRQIIETLTEVHAMAYGKSPGSGMKFHADAQLLIFTGTVDQIEFIQQALSALKQKAIQQRAVRIVRPEAKPEESKKP